MRFTSTLVVAAALALQTPLALAQKYPDHPIKLIVPFAAGGGVDSAARTLAKELQVQMKVPVVVENRAGANGTIGGQAVKSASGDGYTLLFSAATHVLAKQVMASAPYDPVADFTPVARVGEAPLMMVVAPQLPAQNLADVMAAGRKDPGKLTAGIAAAGAPGHLATLLLAKEAKVQFTYVPYKGTQPALTDVAGGHTALLLDSMISLMPLAKAGKVRPVAITSAKRSPLMPDVPTVQEAGMAGMTYVSWYGVWAPKDTPPDRVKMLNEAINTAVAEQSKAGAWATLGIEPVKESVEQFSRFIAKDVGQNSELLKSAGFKPE
jgi:tripartite-type tricarboxylate transporter receptor subunit TctC